MRKAEDPKKLELDNNYSGSCRSSSALVGPLQSTRQFWITLCEAFSWHGPTLVLDHRRFHDETPLTITFGDTCILRLAELEMSPSVARLAKALAARNVKRPVEN